MSAAKPELPVHGQRPGRAGRRAAIVEAAREAFSEDGLDAPLDEIARRAGTGNATMYRRFPTCADLVVAVFAERMAEHLAAVEAGLADSDPWNGFVSYVRAAGAMQAGDRASRIWSRWTSRRRLRSNASGPAPSTVSFISSTGRTAGVLRADFTTEDVAIVLMANAGLAERVHGDAAEASARLIQVLLDGLRSTAATDGPVAPSARRMRLAMRRYGERRLGTTRTRR